MFFFELFFVCLFLFGSGSARDIALAMEQRRLVGQFLAVVSYILSLENNSSCGKLLRSVIVALPCLVSRKQLCHNQNQLKAPGASRQLPSYPPRSSC